MVLNSVIDVSIEYSNTVQVRILTTVSNDYRISINGLDNMILVGINADITRDGEGFFHDILRR